MIVDNIPAGKQIGPMDRLEGGAPVRVGNKIGYVFRSEIVQAVPNGMIVVHEIRLTKSVKRLGPNRYKIKDITETIEPNYSHVYAL